MVMAGTGMTWAVGRMVVLNGTEEIQGSVCRRGHKAHRRDHRRKGCKGG